MLNHQACTHTIKCATEATGNEEAETTAGPRGYLVRPYFEASLLRGANTRRIELSVFLFQDDEDLFATKKAQPKKTKKVLGDDDLFGDSGDIFADVPSKPKEKKKKKTSAGAAAAPKVAASGRWTCDSGNYQDFREFSFRFLNQREVESSLVS